MTEPETAAHTFSSSYPVSLDVAGVPCLVVGGGPVAARKARGLLASGAQVTVVAKRVGPEMQELEPALVAVHLRPYHRGDVSGFRLVLTATGLPDVDGAVYEDAETAGVWVNGADDRAHSSFILPAVHRDGAVTVAVSTGGTSPALAAWLRTRLAAHCEGAGTLAQLLHDARERLRQAGLRSNAVDWVALLDGELPALVQSGDVDNARAILAAILPD